MTWALMSDESVFAQELARFADGCQRRSLKMKARKQIAVLKFPALAETTINEKHGEVTIASRRHGIKPVRVSLVNRLPLLERWLRQGKVQIEDLSECFHEARTLKNVPRLLGFEEHPAFKNIKRMPTWAVRKALSEVLYHCDFEKLHQQKAGER